MKLSLCLGFTVMEDQGEVISELMDFYVLCRFISGGINNVFNFFSGVNI